MLRLLPALLLVTAAQAAEPASLAPLLQDGDIVLHRSTSSQSEALRAATGSPWTHVGLVFTRDGRPTVLEAVQPVRWTPLDAWIRRGEDDDVVVLRLTDGSRLDDGGLAQLRTAAERHLGRPYDILFGWGDDRIYCSELVYKAYDEALDVQVGDLRPLRDFDLSSSAVKALVARRTGGRLDLDEPVVAPVSHLRDDDLTVVYSDDEAWLPGPACAPPGEAVHWLVDLCLARSQTDDLEVPTVQACLDAAMSTATAEPCAFKRAAQAELCARGVDLGTASSMAACLASSPVSPTAAAGGYPAPTP